MPLPVHSCMCLRMKKNGAGWVQQAEHGSGRNLMLGQMWKRWSRYIKECSNESNNSIIGANAVVFRDVPERCSVADVPAKILHTNIDLDKKCNLREIVQSK